MRSVLPCALLLLAARPGHAWGFGSDFTFGGALAFTTDFIYRGLSESGGHGAGQADLHGDIDGTFAGVWGSTRDHDLDPYADYDVELYLGHRFELTSAWGASLSARARYYVGGNQPFSNDYQEITGTVTYLDSWSLSVTAIPNAVQYWYETRLGRTTAWVAETTGQWLLYGGLFVTGSAGYYYATGTGSGIEAANGYAYGDFGLAYEYRGFRLDVGYFLTQDRAQQLSPYPIANDRFAGTLSWRF
jgi:uncharacterized protein (TIGR02001 family)